MGRFDEVTATFWGKGDYGVQQLLTEAMVREAERALGVRLPSALLDLLRVQNGGIVAADHGTYPTTGQTSWSEDHVPFDSLMGIGRRDGMRARATIPGGDLRRVHRIRLDEETRAVHRAGRAVP
ncbi:SMI1/KNR4 family protein [Streptomyces sp. NPDC051217]|uniref:SMI1/KNR4 family protein n=1 Tax=Streptomyces sp. NPDC051217 TaxID=3365644 RepID=UPI00379C891C